MKNMPAVFFFTCFIISHSCLSQTVSLSYDHSSSRQLYAATRLQIALKGHGYVVKESLAEYEIRLMIDAKNLGAESFSILNAGKKITITGGDERGLIYGGLALVEDIRNGISLNNCKS